MNANEVASESLRLISRLASAAVSVSVVTGFVALGAAVLVDRSLREVTGRVWNRLPSLRGSPRDQQRRGPRAA